MPPLGAPSPAATEGKAPTSCTPPVRQDAPPVGVALVPSSVEAISGYVNIGYVNIILPPQPPRDPRGPSGRPARLARGSSRRRALRLRPAFPPATLANRQSRHRVRRLPDRPPAHPPVPPLLILLPLPLLLRPLLWPVQVGLQLDSACRRRCPAAESLTFPCACPPLSVAKPPIEVHQQYFYGHPVISFVVRRTEVAGFVGAGFVGVRGDDSCGRLSLLRTTTRGAQQRGGEQGNRGEVRGGDDGVQGSDKQRREKEGRATKTKLESGNANAAVNTPATHAVTRRSAA